MNIDKLKAFVKVVETGTFQQASMILHRTQPAITKAIKSLEQELGITLFTHTSYRAELTPEGEKLYHKATAIIQDVQNFKNYSAVLAGENENHLRIAIDILYPIKLMASRLDKLMNDFPHTEFSIYSETLGGAMERLLDNEVDMAICEKLSDDVNLEAKELLSEPLIPVVAPDYYYKNQNNFDSPERLTNTLQIILTDSSRNRPKYTFGVVEGANAWTVTNLQTKKSLIESGFGWGRLPLYMIKDNIESGELIELDYPYIPKKKITLSMIRRRNVEHGPISEKLWSEMG